MQDNKVMLAALATIQKQADAMLEMHKTSIATIEKVMTEMMAKLGNIQTGIGAPATAPQDIAKAADKGVLWFSKNAAVRTGYWGDTKICLSVSTKKAEAIAAADKDAKALETANKLPDFYFWNEDKTINGGIWQLPPKDGKSNPWESGNIEISGVKTAIVIFKNDKKKDGSSAPEFNIVVSRPKKK